MNEATKALYMLIMGKEYKWSVVSQYPKIELIYLWDEGQCYMDTIKYTVYLGKGNYTIEQKI